MTREDWDTRWMSVYDTAWKQFKSHDKAFRYAHDYMRAHFGARPEGVQGPPWWLKILVLTGGEKMGAILKLIARFGPLIAAFLVGLAAAIPGGQSIIRGILDALALVGIVPDAQAAEAIGTVVAGALLLYGSIVKGYKLIRDKFFPKV